MRKTKIGKLQVIALAAVIVIVALTASYFFPTTEVLTTEVAAPSYHAGDRWTWQVTRQSLDPLTDNITSTRNYSQTIEYTGEGTRNGYEGGIFKLTVTDQSTQYAQIFRVTEGDEERELLSESFENDIKTSEYLYSAPILFRKFPLRVGLRFSDAKAVSGYDNSVGVESINAFETRVTEVVTKETLMMPAAIDTYKYRSWGTSTGTMHTENATSQIIITYEENIWYSESVKEVVKSTSEATTVVVTSLATSVTKTREEKTLTSYSLE